MFLMWMNIFILPRWGKGPAITIMDASSYANKELVEMLVKTAQKNDIPFQFKKTVTGGNDAGRIHLAQGGSKDSGCISALPLYTQPFLGNGILMITGILSDYYRPF
jgi:putative aminopeptidase FrvX